MPSFELQANVSANVVELRRALGSATRPLSLADLARLLNERDGGSRSASSVQRWERGADPDLKSIALMADLAGISFENFALGTSAPVRTPRPYKGPETKLDDVLKEMGLAPDGTPATPPAEKPEGKRKAGGGR